MRALVYRTRRQAMADLYLALNTGFSAPLIAKGMPAREARDIISVWSLVVSNHAQNRDSTASEITKRLGISRGTVNRRLQVMEGFGYLVFDGSRCHLTDKYAARPLLSPEAVAKIETAIQRAHEALQKAANGRAGKNHKIKGGDGDDDRPQASRPKH